MTDSVELERIDARVHGRYLVRRPRRNGERALLVGFHGFGENAEANMAELRALPGLEAWTLVAIEALHPFYLRSGEVVACWMTRQDRELAIEENIEYVRRVLERVRPRDPACVAMLGYSQGTAMAYRAAAHSPIPISAVVALGGDVPPELASTGSLRTDRILIGRGRDENLYGAEKLTADRVLLEGLGIVPEVFEYEGGHEWTDAFRERASRFLLESS